jgi:acyl-CoA dehydrogenase
VPVDVLERLQNKAREIGLWCVRSPVEYGGAGLSLLGQAVVAEEAAKCRMGAYVPACGAFGADPPNAIWLGTKDQIERYGVPGIQQGKKIYFAISEASGGADPARSIRARAVRKGDKYILNGSKMWITGAKGADWGIVFARTGEQGDRGGITAFIVKGNPEGMSLKPIPVIRSYAPYEITFKDVEVPVEDRLGEEGQGFAICEKWLIEGRIPYAAGTIGVAQAALQIAIEWAKERETFRSKLADKQAIQWMVADSEMELRAARLLTWQAAWIGDLGRGDLKIASSIAKVMATETAGRVVDRAIQILGGLGVSQELPLERWYRELRIKRIGEGRPRCIAWCWPDTCWVRPAEHGSAMSIDLEALDDGIAVITINRPDKRNALDAEHYQALSEAWTRVRDDNAIRVAIITGAGDKVFSAGADLKSWIGRQAPMSDMWQTQKGMLLNRGLEVWKPVIAAINGHCLAGGMTLMLATDLRVTADHATFALSEVKRGIIPANGGTQRLPAQLPHAIAMEMLLIGDAIDAQTAARWGSSTAWCRRTR